MYTGQEYLDSVEKNIIDNQFQYVIFYKNTNNVYETTECVKLPYNKFDKNAIVNALVRSKFTQDEVEAIINNQMLNICQYFDILKKDGTAKANAFLKTVENDPDYNDLQAWRETCKKWADEILEKYK